jgi:hypothetical protein
MYYQNPYMNNYQNAYTNMQYQPQMTQPIYRTAGLQGKVIDNLDVVKAMDISMDGSMNFFPLADGSAIATKQLQQDGTSKIVIYKPVVEKEPIQPKYLTEDELKDIRNDLSTLKAKVESITSDLKEKGGI